MSITIEQIQQQYNNSLFLSKHHEELSKHYLKESFALEVQAAQLEQQQTQPQVQPEPTVKEVKRPVVGREVVEKVDTAIELINKVTGDKQ